MKFAEKQTHPWVCDLTRGDRPCTFVLPQSGGDLFLCCTWKAGHPDTLAHEIVSDCSEDPGQHLWINRPDLSIFTEMEARIAELAAQAPITEQWLKACGFRWDEWKRSGGKHWTLWFGDVNENSFSSFEDLGVEICRMRPETEEWNCWLRSDCSHKYARFIHLRYIATQSDLIQLVVALTGMPWDPRNHLYGAIRRQKTADYIRDTEDRLDRRVMKGNKWAEHEKDETRSRPEVRE